jgi:uncharacterized cofD-like protein
MRPPRRLRLVAFGGGTGLPTLLAGLRDRSDTAVTAIVTVADDGGSSGRLRRELGVSPPGDIRNCLAALSRDRKLAEAFGCRFADGEQLTGHALGNLILVALTSMTGDFCSAVERAARLLDVRGAVYPAACSALSLALHATDGTVVLGESSVASRDGSIARVEAVRPGSGAPAGAVAAIESADVVVLSAGSLFTSTIAALLGTGTREALAAFSGPIVYVANLVTEPGETAGFTLADHVRAITEHAVPRVTDVLVSADRLAEHAVRRHRADGAEPVVVDEAALERMGVRVHRAPLLRGRAGPTVGHDGDRLARAVVAVATERAPEGRSRPTSWAGSWSQPWSTAPWARPPRRRIAS